MEISIKNVKVNYEKTGEGKQVVVLLHGWGCSLDLMTPIANHLNNWFTVYNIDLPGFGKSEEPKEVWTVYDYADFLKDFLDNMNIENPVIIGHSFGCRLAIIFASKNPCYKLVFTGGAGVKDKRGLDYYLKVYSYKAAKKGLSLLHMNKTLEKLQNNAGSSDYKNTSGVMRATFVNVVNEDLTYLLKDIKAETLLIWGENDDSTPLWQAKVMEKEIPNAGLAVFENDDHFAYYHQMNRFLKVLDAFFEADK